MNFNKLVKEIVEPTLLCYGFIIKWEIKGIMEYSDDRLVISLSYDYNSSYEVDMTLLFKKSNKFYGFNELREYFFNEEANLNATQIIDEDTLAKWLEQVKDFLEVKLNDIVNNDELINVELEKIRQFQIKNYETDRNTRTLEKSVEKYWNLKDYFGLVNYLKNYNEEFEGHIRKKYDYSIKMLAKNKIS